MKFNLSMVILELKTKLGSSISWVTSHMGTVPQISTSVRLCISLKNRSRGFLKWLALSQEMLSCLRARSIHSAGRVHSKLVEHCSVALEGICTSKETAFKLGFSAVMNIIVH